jgi:SOS-response transcriptional repressors (RecA-mediated autopeptidases)
MEQRRLIQAKPNGHSIIKGVAGSGKTTVAVNRIPFLLNHYCFAKDDRILMVTYNKTLVNYIKYLYEKVEEENKADYQSIFGGDESKIDIYTIDSIIYKYFEEYKKANRFKMGVLDNSKEKYAILSRCIAEISKTYSNVNILDQKYAGFLIDEIDWIKSCNYMELEEYESTDRLGRTLKQNSDGPQKLMKNSDIRKAIFELMLLYNKRLNEQGYIDFKDMALLALSQAKKGVETKYTHIIIDESQDLTRVQLEFLKLMRLQKEYSSITFISDTAQSIYPHSWLIKGRSFTSIGYDMTGKSNSLTKNYRTTTQIAECAYSLLEKDSNVTEDENFVKPSLIDRQGVYPVYRVFKNPKDEAEYVIGEIKDNLSKTYVHKDIVIIAKNKNQLNYIKECMGKANVPCLIINKADADFEGDSVKLLTMHSIKGLEFKIVIIIGLNDGVIPYISYQDLGDESVQESTDRKLLYVGMTRANELLYLTSSGNPSKFISEINPKYLKLKYKSRVDKYYNIQLDNYLYKDRIIDLYSNEEKVRQWMLKELMDNYKYPAKLVDVEYKLNNFSKVGSVDIAVSIYSNNNCVPYIFVETKALYNGLQNGLEQLKSYMSNSKTCQYGIVTDGNEFVTINKDFEPIEDIPYFNPSMLPSSIESYNYIDIKHNQKYLFTRDGSYKSELVVKSGNDKLEYSEDRLKSINVYNDIAAGKPIYMSSDVVRSFYLPRDWFKGAGEMFILNVRGDSMQGAGIKNGDMVVVQRQQTAENRDIVAVAIDENATLKRYMKMGDTILLIPENEKYEPIQIRSDQASIIGVAVGIIKRNN